MRRTSIILISGLIAIASPSIFAQGSLLEQARAAFLNAQKMEGSSSEKAASNRKRSDSLRLIEAYQRVYLITPHTAYADDALLAIARLYEEIQDPADAIKTLRFMIRDYPQTPFKVAAERDIERLQGSREPKESVSQERTVERNPEPILKPESAPAPVVSERSGKNVFVENVRYWEGPNSVRIVIDVTGDIRFTQGEAKSPDRVFVDISGAKLNLNLLNKQWSVSSGLLRQIRAGQYDNTTVRIVLDVGSIGAASSFTLREPDRLIIDVLGRGATALPRTVENPFVAPPVSKVSPPSTPPVSNVSPISAANISNVSPIAVPAAPLAAVPSQPILSSAPAPAVSNAGLPPAVVPASPARGSAPLPAVSNAGAPPVAVPASPARGSAPATTASNAGAPPVAIPASPARGASPAPIAAVTAPPAPAGTGGTTPTPAKPTNRGGTSLVRSLGLKLSKVVIDAGHGGNDTGTIGPTGYSEKDLSLDVARRLKALIEAELGAEVVLTRSDDVFVPLEARTAIANQNQADLFISIHANSSKVSSARGVETFYLNYPPPSRDALELASRENASSQASIHELQDIIKKIMMNDKASESRELAGHIQKAMAARKDAGPDRGVKEAPFVVLIGANMPSILAEIGFISNPQEERSAKTPAYRQQIAESLFKGIRSYAETLSGVKTANTYDKK